MEKQFLTQEEIQRLTELSTRYSTLKSKFGEIEIQIMSLSESKKELKNELKLLQTEEMDLAKELENKYGNGSISLKDGEFIPSK